MTPEGGRGGRGGREGGRKGGKNTRTMYVRKMHQVSHKKQREASENCTVYACVYAGVSVCVRQKGTTHTSGTLESMSTSLLVERIESSLSPSHPPPPPPPLLLSEVLLRLPLTAAAGRLMAREAGTTEREISLPAIPDRHREREPCMVSEVMRERSSFRGPYWSASCSRELQLE